VEPDSLPPLLDRVARTAQGIGPSRRILSRRMVERAHERGLFVHAYTVNDPAVLAWVRGIGVDGVFTDRPGMVRAQLGR
jgi:glycerophosphoryl diester phosphodiesterase